MLEAISLRDGGTPDGKIDFGLLAEALVFYGKVHFVSNHAAYAQLLRVIGPYETLELITRGHLAIHVARNQIGVSTEDVGTGRERHDFGYVALAEEDPEEKARSVFAELAGKGTASVPEVRRFSDALHYIKRPGFDLDAVRSSLDQDGSFGPTIVSWLRRLAPQTTPANASIEIWKLGDSRQVGVNFDLAAVAASIKSRHPNAQFEGTAAWLLANYVAILEDSYYAAQLSAEVSTNVLKGRSYRRALSTCTNVRARASRRFNCFKIRSWVIHALLVTQFCLATRSWANLIQVLERRERFRNG